MADLAMSPEAALDYAYKAGVGTREIGKKAVKQWFARKAIPAYAVFNIAAAMGIDVAWLGGSNRVSKEKAVHKGGFYHHEIDRIERLRHEFAAAKPRRKA